MFLAHWSLIISSKWQHIIKTNGWTSIIYLWIFMVPREKRLTLWTDHLNCSKIQLYPKIKSAELDTVNSVLRLNLWHVLWRRLEPKLFGMQVTEVWCEYLHFSYIKNGLITEVGDILCLAVELLNLHIYRFCFFFQWGRECRCNSKNL